MVKGEPGVRESGGLKSVELVDKGASLIGNSFFYWTWESWIMFGREIVHPSGSP